MVDGGSTRMLPPGTSAARSVALRARRIPAPFGPPVYPEVRTDVCHAIEELDEVFGSRGAAAHCWCQFDRMAVCQFQAFDDVHRRQMLASQLRGWPVPGVVATLGGERVGWCSVAPRSAFTRLRRAAATWSPVTAVDDPAVWAVTCFVVRPGFRRRGVARALLEGAINHARSSGAGWLEAYPVDPARRQGSVADLYRGTLSLFRAAGFEVVARPRPGRAIVRLEL